MVQKSGYPPRNLYPMKCDHDIELLLMAEILQQLGLVDYPIIYRALSISGGDRRISETSTVLTMQTASIRLFMIFAVLQKSVGNRFYPAVPPSGGNATSPKLWFFVSILGGKSSPTRRKSWELKVHPPRQLPLRERPPALWSGTINPFGFPLEGWKLGGYFLGGDGSHDEFILIPWKSHRFLQQILHKPF